MVFRIDKLKLKRDFDKIQALTYIQILFVSMAFIDEWSRDVISLSTLIIKTLIFFGIYRLNFKLKSKFNYSYWPFALLLLIYFFFHAKLPIIFSVEIYHLFYFSLMFILTMEMYLLWSPIYYPRVMWWEYDFRFRDDLKIKINLDNNEVNGRLTDMRRNAACIILFENLKIGQFFQFNPEGINYKFKVKVISKRIEIVGRPILYGVKFILNNEEEKRNYNKFSKYYRDEKNYKQEIKLSELKVNNE